MIIETYLVLTSFNTDVGYQEVVILDSYETSIECHRHIMVIEDNLKKGIKLGCVNKKGTILKI